MGVQFFLHEGYVVSLTAQPYNSVGWLIYDLACAEQTNACIQLRSSGISSAALFSSATWSNNEVKFWRTNAI